MREEEAGVWIAYCDELDIIFKDLIIVGQGGTKKKAVQDFRRDFTDTVLLKLSQARLTIALDRLVDV